MSVWCERRRFFAAVVANLVFLLFAVAFVGAVIADLVIEAYEAPPQVYAGGLAVLAGLAGSYVGSGRGDE